MSWLRFSVSTEEHESDLVLTIATSMRSYASWAVQGWRFTTDLDVFTFDFMFLLLISCLNVDTHLIVEESAIMQECHWSCSMHYDTLLLILPCCEVTCSDAVILSVVAWVCEDISTGTSY